MNLIEQAMTAASDETRRAADTFETTAERLEAALTALRKEAAAFRQTLPDSSVGKRVAARRRLREAQKAQTFYARECAAIRTIAQATRQGVPSLRLVDVREIGVIAGIFRLRETRQ